MSQVFVQKLSEEVPSIAVQTMSAWDAGRTSFIADYASRGMPVLLLDSRPKPIDPAGKVGYPDQLEAAYEHLEMLEKELQKQGQYNFYWMSTMAFFHECLQAHRTARAKATGRRDHRGSMVGAVTAVGLRNRRTSISEWQRGGLRRISEEIASMQMEEEEEADSSASTAPSGYLTDQEFAKQAINYMQRLNNMATEHRIEHERNRLDRLAERCESCTGLDELDTLLQTTSAMWAIGGLDAGHLARTDDVVKASSQYFRKKEVDSVFRSLFDVHCIASYY